MTRLPTRAALQRWLGRIGVWGSCLACACRAPQIGPPPSAPSVTRPLDAMPADLDLVVRLDLRRIRETLGASAMDALSEQAVHGLRGADRATDALLLSALAETDTLWLGLRPTRGLDGADAVFVMAGHFPGFDPHGMASTPRFQRALELGGDLRRYDRAAPQARSAPARIYTHGEDLVVSLTEAEVDSVERSFEERRGAPSLEPAEQGALSAVARPRVLPTELFAGSAPLRDLAVRAERCELSADLTSAGIDATVALRFEDASSAEHVAQALTDLRDALQSAPGRLAKFAARVKVSSAARYVSLGLSLGRDELSELVNCRGSACAW